MEIQQRLADLLMQDRQAAAPQTRPVLAKFGVLARAAVAMAGAGRTHSGADAVDLAVVPAVPASPGIAATPLQVAPSMPVSLTRGSAPTTPFPWRAGVLSPLSASPTTPLPDGQPAPFGAVLRSPRPELAATFRFVAHLRPGAAGVPPPASLPVSSGLTPSLESPMLALLQQRRTQQADVARSLGVLL
jgi:hypothetical protein